MSLDFAILATPMFGMPSEHETEARPAADEAPAAPSAPEPATPAPDAPAPPPAPAGRGVDDKPASDAPPAAADPSPAAAPAAPAARPLASPFADVPRDEAQARADGAPKKRPLGFERATWFFGVMCDLYDSVLAVSVARGVAMQPLDEWCKARIKEEGDDAKGRIFVDAQLILAACEEIARLSDTDRETLQTPVVARLARWEVSDDFDLWTGLVVVGWQKVNSLSRAASDPLTRDAILEARRKDKAAADAVQAAKAAAEMEAVKAKAKADAEAKARDVADKAKKKRRGGGRPPGRPRKNPPAPAAPPAGPQPAAAPPPPEA